MKGHPTLLRLTLVISLFLLTAIEAQAQGDFVRARVRSFTGIARIYVGPQSGAFAPKRNDPLKPGNIIETDNNGRVVISLSDGGQITVLPNSKVVLKNFLVAHSARELLDIVVGRVLVKIRSVGGKPNPYRLNSPAASIAVRGTEFIVDVQLGGETMVLVREGLVEVWPRNNPGNKRLVTPGGRVTVLPGGGISSAFPGPRRSLESVALDTSDISPIFFSAFPDQHLDSLDNPAYAAEVKEAQGRLLLLPSISEPDYVEIKDGDSSSKDPSYFDYSVSPQLTFFMPIPGSRLVIGGGASALRAKLQQQTNIQLTNYQVYGNQVTMMNALNTSIIAAYSFGDQGRTSAGIGIDRLSGDHNVSNHYTYNGTSYYFPDNKKTKYSQLSSYNSAAHYARTRLTLGLARRLSGNMKIGLYYRHAFNSSDQGFQQQRGYNNESLPDVSYFTAGSANVLTFSSSSELGFRFRGSLTRRLFYGTEGSYLYERIRSRREAPDQAAVHNRYLARRARLGVGLGFLLTSKILLNLDMGGGFFNNNRPPNEPLVAEPNFFSMASLPPSSPNTLRAASVSAHAAVQANPWRNFILSFSNLTAIRKDTYIYNYNGMSGRYTDKSMSVLYNTGLGWKFKPNFIAEYLLSVDPRERVPSHSLRLRYTFNLGVTGEK